MHSVWALKDRNPTLFGDRQRERKVDFRTILSIFFCFLKKHGHFSTQKESTWQISTILSNLENRYKTSTWGWLVRIVSITIFSLLFFIGRLPCPHHFIQYYQLFNYNAAAWFIKTNAFIPQPKEVEVANRTVFTDLDPNTSYNITVCCTLECLVYDLRSCNCNEVGPPTYRTVMTKEDGKL